MRGLAILVFFVFLVPLLAACSDDASGAATDAGAKPSSTKDGGGADDDAGAAALAHGVQVYRVVGTQSPIYLVAVDEAGQALAVLAQKDATGNAVALTGIALFDGKGHYVRYEVDSLGRPRLAESPELRVTLSHYTESSLHLVTALEGDAPREQTVTLTPEQLAEFRSPMPSLVDPGMPKVDPQAVTDTGNLGNQLAEAVSHTLSTFSCVKSAVGAGALSKPTLGEIAGTALELSLECSKFLVDNIENHDRQRLVDAIKYGVSTVACIGDVSALVIGGPVAAAEAPELVLEASKIVLDECNSGLQAQMRLLAPEPAEPVNTLAHAGISPALVQNKGVDATVTFQAPNGKDQFKSVTVDLYDVGGPTISLNYSGGFYKGTAHVLPRDAGVFHLPLYYDGAFITMDASVAPDRTPDVPKVSIDASATVVYPQGSVTLTAMPAGGTPPYECAWAKATGNTTTSSLTLVDMPVTRTQYQVACKDSTPKLAVADIWVAVCGDEVCSPEESTLACPTDCGTDPDPTTMKDELPPKVTYDSHVVGDPHLLTPDGLRYDAQPEGEVVLVKSLDDDFELQMRTKRGGIASRVAIIVAAAARVGDTSFFIDPSGKVRIDGEVMKVTEGKSSLSGNVELYRQASVYTLVWPDGSQVRFEANTTHLNLFVHLSEDRKGRIDGLFGNFDGDVGGDLAVRGGGVLPSQPSFTFFYATFIESWRVTQEASLLYYAAGETTETFTDRTFPPELATPAGLSSSVRAAAETTCLEAGVKSDWLDACVVDVGYTGDDGFAADFAHAHAAIGSLEVQPDSGGGDEGLGIGGGKLQGMLGNGSSEATYEFQGTSGQGVQIRVADVSDNAFVPRIALYDAADKLIGSHYGADVAALSLTLASTGRFRIVVSDASGQAGIVASYDLQVAIAPGASEGGALSSGGMVSDTIDRGDLDSYTFSASAGEGVQLRVVDSSASSFVPTLVVYGPAGNTVGSHYSADVAALSFTTQAAGTYTVVVTDTSSGYAGSGDYTLHFIKAPSASEGGALSSGGMVSDTIDRGDLDSYTFSASAGEGVQLRVVDSSASSFVPTLVVYGPAGNTVGSHYSADVAALSFTTQAAGTYTVVVTDTSSGYAGSGDYTLHFIKAPSANEGGALSSGGMVSDTIDRGDLDSYTFSASAGEGVQLRVVDSSASSFVPTLVVYGPAGNTVGSHYSADVAALSFTTQAAGTYTVVVTDTSSGYAGSGDYTLHFIKAPSANEGGALSPGARVNGHIDRGDLDSYTFNAAAGQGVQLRAADLNGLAFVPTLVVYGPAGNTVGSHYSADVAALSFTTQAAGTYTVVVTDTSSGYAGSGDYALEFALAPGANEGGALAAGVTVSGTIDLGDLDSYTLALTAGQMVVLQVTDTAASSFVPTLVVYGPTGSTLGSRYAADTASLTFTAQTTGTCTILISDNSSGYAATGDYELTTTVQ